MGNKSSSFHESPPKSHQNKSGIYSNHKSAPTTPRIPQNDFISTPAGTIKSILKNNPKGSLSSDSSSSNSSSRQSVKFIEDFMNSNHHNKLNSNSDNSDCPTIKKSAQINHNRHQNGRIGHNMSLSGLFSSSTETLTENDKESTLKSRKLHNNIKTNPISIITYDKKSQPTSNNHTNEPFKSECTLLPSFVETVRNDPNKFERTKIDKPYSTVNSRILINNPTNSPNFLNNSNPRVYQNNKLESKTKHKYSPSELKKWNDTNLSFNGSMFNLSGSASDLQFV